MALSGRPLLAPLARRRPGSASQRPVRMVARRGEDPVADRRPGGALSAMVTGAGDGRLQHERLVDVQRARVLGAMTHVAAERGAGNVTVAHVVGRAGVSRRTFYELFGDVEECLLAAIDEAVERARRRLRDADDPQASWRVRIRAGLVALLGLFDEQPALARLLVVESLAGGPSVLARRERALRPLIAAVEEGRGQSKRAAGVPALAGESVVGGVCSLVYARIVQDDGRPLSRLANELMSMIVLPYLGLAAAHRELGAPAPPSTGAPEPASAPPLRSDPFKAAGMRLTYRTIRVLGAIAAEPGASNRRIGDAAEIGDQGQISKLLARLQRLGLVINGSPGHIKGEANAWTLTPTGRQVANNVQPQTHTTTQRTDTPATRTPTGREQ